MEEDRGLADLSAASEADRRFARLIDPIIARTPPGELRDYYIWLRNPFKPADLGLARKSMEGISLRPEGHSRLTPSGFSPKISPEA